MCLEIVYRAIMYYITNALQPYLGNKRKYLSSKVNLDAVPPFTEDKEDIK